MAAPFIPPKTISKMQRLGLGETRVLDVFNHGEYKRLPSGADAMVKKYAGYEVGLLYTRDSITGEYIITHVWTRARR